MITRKMFYRAIPGEGVAKRIASGVHISLPLRDSQNGLPPTRRIKSIPAKHKRPDNTLEGLHRDPPKLHYRYTRASDARLRARARDGETPSRAAPSDRRFPHASGGIQEPRTAFGEPKKSDLYSGQSYPL